MSEKYLLIGILLVWGISWFICYRGVKGGIEKLNKILQKNGINSRYISNKDSEYSGGIFVLTSSSSKGLEFDAVIIKDASKDIYMSESDVDMHLLYVASTRALHELEILYDNDITSVYEDKIRENKVKTLKMN